MSGHARGRHRPPRRRRAAPGGRPHAQGDRFVHRRQPARGRALPPGRAACGRRDGRRTARATGTMTPLRVALVAEDYYPQLGGVPEHVHHLARELEALGHHATIVTSHMRMNGTVDPPNVRRVGTSLVIYANGGVARITVGWRLTARLEAFLAKQRFEPGREPPPDRNARDAAVRIDHEARAHAPHVWRVDGAVHAHVRSHDRRVMPQGLELPGEMVHVLRHAAELRVVVLRDERDAQWSHRARCASRTTAVTTAAGRSSWR